MVGGGSGAQAKNIHYRLALPMCGSVPSLRIAISSAIHASPATILHSPAPEYAEIPV